MADVPALVAADGVSPLRRMMNTDIAGASLMSARSIFTGSPADGLDPARLASILKAAEEGQPLDFLELAEAMEERYLHYLGVLGTRKRQVSQLPITVEAASDDPVDQQKAQVIRDWLRRDTLEAELFDMLDAVGKGFSMTEIVWDLGGALWLPDRLEWRDPRWFEFDRIDGRTPLLRGGISGTPSAGGAPQPLPPFKFIYHAHPAKSGLPIRGGIARAAAWAYLFQSFSLKDWVQFAEVYGFPIRLGKYDAGASEDQIRTLLRAVANVARDAAAVFPSSMQMELIQSSANGSAEVWEKLCEYLDKQVSKAVLGQTATTDSQGGGLGGSGKEHNDVRGDIERADAKLLASSLNRDLVKPIIDLNFGRPGDGSAPAYPKIVIGREDPVDTDALMKGVEAFVALGGRVGENVVRDLLKFPDPAPGERLLMAPVQGLSLQGPAQPQPAPGGGVDTQNAADPLLTPLKPSYAPIPAGIAAAIEALAPNSDDIDAIVQMLADDGWEAAMAPIIDPLRASLTAAGDYPAALAGLAGALAGMDSDALAQRLERAAFAVREAAATGADGQLENGQ